MSEEKVSITQVFDGLEEDNLPKKISRENVMEVEIIQNKKYNNYHSIECCDKTLGIDNLIERYENDRRTIVKMLRNNVDELIDTIWTLNSPLAFDDHCQCQMGKGEERSVFSCAQCHNIRRLKNLNHQFTSDPFLIECGSEAGNYFVSQEYKVISPFLKKDMDSKKAANLFVKRYPKLQDCGTPNFSDLEKTFCVAGDNFTIQTLIHWILYDHFNSLDLPHIPLLHTSFICKGTGYSIYEYSDLGNIDYLLNNEKYILTDFSKNIKYLDPSITKTIIDQLIITFLETKKYAFSHGSPHASVLLFSESPVSYMYDQYHVEGDITLQLSNFWFSSLTYHNNHFFSKNFDFDVYVEKNMFIPSISTLSIPTAYCDYVNLSNQNNIYNIDDNDIPCPLNSKFCPNSNTRSICQSSSVNLYKLTSSTINIYSGIRHMGLPLYVSSFDFYCLFVSLMCYEKFYYSVINDPKLYKLWSMIWTVDDFPKIQKYVIESHPLEKTVTHDSQKNKYQSNMTIDIIRGSWLRCDVVDFVWRLINTDF